MKVTVITAADPAAVTLLIRSIAGAKGDYERGGGGWCAASLFIAGLGHAVNQSEN